MTDVSLTLALEHRRTCREFDGRALPLPVVHRLLWAAQGITGAMGERTAPSAHALHPLRLVLVVGAVEGLESGVYAADPQTGRLTMTVHRDVRGELQAAALDDQPWIGLAPFMLTLCADFVTPAKDFADQPPFGQRGERYVYIEAGAAAQNVQLQAVSEGLGCVLVAGFKDEATANLLDLKPPLAPVLHLCLGWPQIPDGTVDLFSS